MVLIADAEFYEHSHLVRERTLLSEDNDTLAVVSRGPDALYRVQLFRRGTEPGYSGLWWNEVGVPSIVDTLERADALARARLRLSS